MISHNGIGALRRPHAGHAEQLMLDLFHSAFPDHSTSMRTLLPAKISLAWDRLGCKFGGE